MSNKQDYKSVTIETETLVPDVKKTETLVPDVKKPEGLTKKEPEKTELKKEEKKTEGTTKKDEKTKEPKLTSLENFYPLKFRKTNSHGLEIVCDFTMGDDGYCTSVMIYAKSENDGSIQWSSQHGPNKQRGSDAIQVFHKICRIINTWFVENEQAGDRSVKFSMSINSLVVEKSKLYIMFTPDKDVNIPIELELVPVSVIKKKSYGIYDWRYYDWSKPDYWRNDYMNLRFDRSLCEHTALKDFLDLKL